MLRRNTEHIRFKNVDDFPYPTIEYIYVGGKDGGYEPAYLPADWEITDGGYEVIVPASLTREDWLKSPNPLKRGYAWLEFGVSALMCVLLGIVLCALCLAGIVMLVLGLFK